MAHLRGLFDDVVSHDTGGSRRRRDQGVEHSNQRALARAVRPENPEDLAVRHREIEIVVRDELPELLCQVLHNDRRRQTVRLVPIHRRPPAILLTSGLTAIITSAVMPSLSKCSRFGTRAITVKVRMSRRSAPQSLRVAKSPAG